MRKCRASGRAAVIISQKTAEPFLTNDCFGRRCHLLVWGDEPIAQPLMIPLGMIVCHPQGNRSRVGIGLAVR